MSKKMGKPRGRIATFPDEVSESLLLSLEQIICDKKVSWAFVARKSRISKPQLSRLRSGTIGLSFPIACRLFAVFGYELKISVVPPKE